MKTEDLPQSETLHEFWGVARNTPAPLDLDREFHLHLHEKYDGAGTTGGGRLVRAYYGVKPLLPRYVQLWGRQRHARTRGRATFPSWPVETRCWDLAREWLVRASTLAGGDLPVVEFWPYGRKFALVLTHDVEHQAGFDSIEEIARIEEDLGLRSSWNLVPERYRVDSRIIRRLWDAGHEVGVHGLKHDGRLFSSRRVFEERLVAIHRYAETWGAVGFRSPATYRNGEWMQSMRFEYDASFFDTDPYEPQRGGCCHVFPFRLGRLIELPYTLPQDHTLFEVLRINPLHVWLHKARWVRSVGGMVLMITHPDYLDSEERRMAYRQFLEEISRWGDAWHALPMEVARWWSGRLESYATLAGSNSVRLVTRDSRMRATIFQQAPQAAERPQSS